MLCLGEAHQGDGGLGALLGEGVEARAGATAEDDGEHVLLQTDDERGRKK